MKFLTLRCMYATQTVLALLNEPEFEDNAHLLAWRDAKPPVDLALAVFVFRAEPVEGGRRVFLISSTVLALQKYSFKRLQQQGVYVLTSFPEDTIYLDCLRAHFRSAQQRLVETLEIAQVPRIRSGPSDRMMYNNGAGDLDEIPEFVINDPEAEELEKLFGGGLSESEEE